MADEYAGERTESATPRRRLEARERGQVARSGDLSAALALLAGLWLLDVWGPDLMGALLNLQREWLGRLAQPVVDIPSVMRLFTEGTLAFVLSAAPILGGLLLVGVAVNLFQVGFVFTLVPLEPQWERLDPIAGFGRLFAGGALVKLVLNVLKLGAIGWVAWRTLSANLPSLEGMMGRTVPAIFAMTGQIVFLMGIRIALVLLLLGILDYAWQRWDFERGLRMTKQELKEEMKRMEGDPMVRSRRLQLARQLARQRMMKKVPEADVVITNPTEIAVAIQYDPVTMSAPVVVAKGARLVAQRIRELALEHGVPLVERKPLARALYKNVEIGQAVPQEYWAAVQEIMIWVYQLDSSMGARWGVKEERASA